MYQMKMDTIFHRISCRIHIGDVCFEIEASWIAIIAAIAGVIVGVILAVVIAVIICRCKSSDGTDEHHPPPNMPHVLPNAKESVAT